MCLVPSDSSCYCVLTSQWSPPAAGLPNTGPPVERSDGDVYMFSAGQMLADYNLINSCPGRDEDNLELTGAVGRDRDTGHQDQ